MLENYRNHCASQVTFNSKEFFLDKDGFINIISDYYPNISGKGRTRSEALDDLQIKIKQNITL
ncbi:MAG: hypothetical protein P4L22_01455 [Candidatus Babeliales bacterium]|nr:hypothetical protein [Candidatus Babeliales bacterium]